MTDVHQNVHMFGSPCQEQSVEVVKIGRLHLDVCNVVGRHRRQR